MGGDGDAVPLQKFAERGVRDLKGYNKCPQGRRKANAPRWSSIIDELRNFMIVAPGEVEDSICAAGPTGAGAGMHL